MINVIQVKIVSDDKFKAEDFVWTKGNINKPVDFDDPKFKLKNGGKTLEVISAEYILRISTYLLKLRGNRA